MARTTLSSPGNQLVVDWRYDGDFYVVIEVMCRGFSGHADGHVAEEDFERFRKELRALEKTRDGKAILQSVLPGAFTLVVGSYDRLGHMEVRGSLSFELPGSATGYTQTLTFGFEFDPSSLAAFAKSFDGTPEA